MPGRMKRTTEPSRERVGLRFLLFLAGSMAGQRAGINGDDLSPGEVAKDAFEDALAMERLLRRGARLPCGCVVADVCAGDQPDVTVRERCGQDGHVLEHTAGRAPATPRDTANPTADLQSEDE